MMIFSQLIPAACLAPFFLLFSVSDHAKRTESSGGDDYIINHEKDTITGNIELINTGAGSNHELMYFEEEKGDRTKLFIGDIQGFKHDNNRFVLLRHHGLYPDYGRKGLCYMRIVEEDELNLYAFSYLRNYESDDPLMGGKLEANKLVTDYYIDSKTFFQRLEHEHYKDQIFNFIDEYPELARKIGNMEFKYGDIEPVVEKINQFLHAQP